MYEQRKVNQKFFRRREREPFWSPSVLKGRKRVVETRTGANDWYAVVDDIGEGTVKLEIASWPKLDKAGRLHFDEIYEQAYSVEKLQRVINKARMSHKQPAPDRLLRVGDAFRIQNSVRPKKDLVSPRFKGIIYDITEAAREQAKIAMYGAVARKLKPSEARERYKTFTSSGRFRRKAVKPSERHRPRIPGATAEPEV